MISNEKIKTKVIWTIDCQKTDSKKLQEITSYFKGPVRLLYSPLAHEAILKTIEYLRADSILREYPIILDLSENPHSDKDFLEENSAKPISKSAPKDASKGAPKDTALKQDSLNENLYEITLDTFFKFESTFLKDHELDCIILSSHMKKKQMKDLKNHFQSKDKSLPFILFKIDSEASYKKLPALLEESTGIMIARRELALTMEPALIPIISKEIIQECQKQAKLVFIASETLASMRQSPTPTRAEVSDLANAVIDKVDGIILSEDIAFGDHGAKAVTVCINTLKDVEQNLEARFNWKKSQTTITTESDAIAFHAYRTAERIGAKAVVCLTKKGNTAIRLASYGIPLPIIAVTFSKTVKRQLHLMRGVNSLLLETNPSIDQILPAINEILKKENFLKSGDLIVFVTWSLSPLSLESSNLFTIQKIE